MRGNPVRDPRQLGLALRQRRRELGLTQTQVAERAGVRAATVSAVENGDPGAKLSTIFALLIALDLELAARRRTRAELTAGSAGVSFQP
jgi:HTH-type transcriptional regulator / antitoxin HipB